MFAIQFRVLLLFSGAVIALCSSQRAMADACDGFVDVDSTASYCSAITFIKSRNITVGCSDTTHYCPNDYVTRAQMALYLLRAAQASSTNTLGPDADAIGGGIANTANGGDSFVGAGMNNQATGLFSGITSGQDNSASTFGATVGGGSENWASGGDSTVPGGTSNLASGLESFAAGFGANADQQRCTVYSLWSGSNAGLSCLGTANVFRVGGDHGFSVDYHTERSDGGGTRWVAIGDTSPGQTIVTWTGAYLSDGGAWTSVSDRAAKADFMPVDAQAVLQKVAAMPMDTWRYKVESGQRHLGPMAQDFYAAFGLGADDRHITSIDEEGVALAAIQGLNAKLEAMNARLETVNAMLQSVNAVHARQLAAMQAQVGALMQQSLASSNARATTVGLQ